MKKVARERKIKAEGGEGGQRERKIKAEGGEVD